MTSTCCSASVTLDDFGTPYCKKCYEDCSIADVLDSAPGTDGSRYEIVLIHGGSDSAVFLADGSEDPEWTMTYEYATSTARKAPGRWFDHSDITYGEFLAAGGDDSEECD